MSEQSILLISYGNFEKEFLNNIATKVAQEFMVPVHTEDRYIDLEEFYDPMRRQYDGNRILFEINTINSSHHFKKVGLFNVDLFIPILTYIFGQATLNGSAGIATLHRLRNEYYGMKKDENLLLDRFGKVIIHELGHTYGLVHCHNPTCVMRSSTYVEDIDQKSHNLCIGCRSEIQRP